MEQTLAPPKALPKTLFKGEVCGWQIPEQVNLTKEDVRTALKAAALDENEAKELHAGNAFRRACKQMKQDRSIDKVENQQHGIVRFQLTRKTFVENKIDFNFEAIITLDTEFGRVTCKESPAIEALAQKLLDEAKMKRTAQDVTRLLQRLFKKNADLWPLIPSKGVCYFVPEAHRAFSTKMQMLVERLGGEMIRFPCDNSTSWGRKAMCRVVKEGLANLIKEVSDAEKEFTEATQDKTIENAGKKLQAIELKVESYADVLGDVVADLKNTLKETKDRIVKHMTQE